VSMAPFLRYSASSHQGYNRANNEDAVYAGPRLLALADGVGGHAAGEVAASLAIAHLAPLDDSDSADPLAELRAATERANEAIADYAATHPGCEGMGTTLTAMMFAAGRAGLVHVGDSRAYLMRDRFLTQITKDETFVQSLIDAGRLTPGEAQTHPHRSVVLRVLTGKPLEPAVQLCEARVGDRYLICSDGISDTLDTDALAEALRLEADPQRCVDSVLLGALRAGSADNVACIVADVVDRDLGYNTPIVGGAAGDERKLVRH
jgi:serine/threonine protein phosphatase PrpC